MHNPETTRIVWGQDTKSVEGFDQCVAMDIPSDIEDVEDSLRLALKAEGLDAITTLRIVTTVAEAIDNNS